MGKSDKEKTPKTLAELLVYQRKLRGISQNKLAKELKIAQSTLGRWESGEAFPNNENLDLIIKTLNIDVSDLLDTNMFGSRKDRDLAGKIWLEGYQKSIDSHVQIHKLQLENKKLKEKIAALETTPMNELWEQIQKLDKENIEILSVLVGQMLSGEPIEDVVEDYFGGPLKKSK